MNNKENNNVDQITCQDNVFVISVYSLGACIPRTNSNRWTEATLWQGRLTTVNSSIPQASER